MGPHCVITLGDIRTTRGDKCLPGHPSIYRLTRPRSETRPYFGPDEHIYLLGLAGVLTHEGPWADSPSTGC